MIRLSGLLTVTILATGPVFAGELTSSAARLSHYVEGYNLLVGTFGLTQEARSYLSQNVMDKAAGSTVTVSDGSITAGLNELNKGRDQAGGDLPEADAVVGEIVPILDRLTQRLKGLQGYYASQGQLVDGFKRGKEEDPLVRADFKSALAELSRLHEALDISTDRRDAANLTQLKAAGNEIGYQGGKALMDAKRLIGLFHMQADLKDKNVLQKADELATGILNAVQAEQAALKAAKSAPSGGSRDAGFYQSASEDLQSVVGDYRQLVHSGDEAYLHAMFRDYNKAVASMNMRN